MWKALRVWSCVSATQGPEALCAPTDNAAAGNWRAGSLSCRSPLAMPGVGEAAFLLVFKNLVCLEQNK